MPEISFESINQSLARLPEAIQSIPDIIRNPAANPLQAAILLGIALVIVLILLLSVVLLFMRAPLEEEELLDESELAEGEEPLSAEEMAAAQSEYKAERRATRLTVTSLVVVAGFALWIAMGITSADSQVCASCHLETSHVAAKAQDPHADVKCVACHEGGGTVARSTVNVFGRVQHVVYARLRMKVAAQFGSPVASDRCLACHEGQISKTVVDRDLGVKVSHKEPLDAGAQCVDCHALMSGVVSSATVGMSTCLRCHDGKVAKAECDTCHVGDPAVAIRPNTPTTELASLQVPNPTCGGCHKDMTKCDACHGIRMPHSTAFKANLHARAGAIDIWDNNGQTCRKCHYPGHNNCLQTGCHVGFFPSHPPSWKQQHQKAPWPSLALAYRNDACPCHNWRPNDHAGQVFCQICHPVKPPGVP